MGCKSSKDGQLEDSTTKLKQDQDNDESQGGEHLSGKSVVKPVNISRMSSAVQAMELGSDRTTSGSLQSRGKSDLAIDKALIGTHTRHGVMPGPRGYVAAKINQDRGVVYWPYNQSFNEALLCVFDGHGSKGEKVSECCIEVLPERLEADADALRNDPATVLSETVIQFDKELLQGTLGPQAHTCGTTSIIVYLNGQDCWTACSGDSRAVKGVWVGGKYEAVDLSEDCKPDTPSETVRIRAAGGVVSPSVGGRPSRVWANGRIGLAMSRSLGDGECKRFGVIADPEIKSFKLAPAAGDKEDGDKFLIVASDGVWEFISSHEAVQIVAQSGDATAACAELVQQAAHRWKVNEGNYRDDITAIVAFLPFLQPTWDAEADEVEKAKHQGNGDGAKAVEADNRMMINQNMVGISRMESGEMSPDPDERADSQQGTTSADIAGSPKADSAEDDEEGATATFAKRRLSMNNPFEDDADWLQLEPGSPAGDHPAEGTTGPEQKI